MGITVFVIPMQGYILCLSNAHEQCGCDSYFRVRSDRLECRRIPISGVKQRCAAIAAWLDLQGHIVCSCFTVISDDNSFIFLPGPDAAPRIGLCYFTEVVPRVQPCFFIFIQCGRLGRCI
ncbi:hypothetical protein C5F51_13000 [Nocardia nova]|uniref:Uncharacterized protein n=1 Tax=Nocardia nova TaxID=37330 RepID=A0A2S6A8M9_9NOCA|nr:hypothetical protein C5F51_13000 [Nocardia nova]